MSDNDNTKVAVPRRAIAPRRTPECNDALLETRVRKHTAFASYREMSDAMRSGYIPTIALRKRGLFQREVFELVIQLRARGHQVETVS